VFAIDRLDTMKLLLFIIVIIYFLRMNSLDEARLKAVPSRVVSINRGLTVVELLAHESRVVVDVRGVRGDERSSVKLVAPSFHLS
jgi:hypothetical protein